MSSKPTSGLSGILEFSLSSESNHQVVDQGHDFASIPHGHSYCIFFEGYVTATVKSCFNTPMKAVSKSCSWFHHIYDSTAKTLFNREERKEREGNSKTY